MFYINNTIKNIRKMEINGWFFGSFNPLHNGHVSIVNTARLYFDKVIVCPSYQNPFKDKSKPLEERLHLLNKVFDKYSGVEVSDMDLKLKTKTSWEFFNNSDFSIKNDIIITTNETYSEIKNWDHGKEILRACNFFLVDKEREIEDIPFAKIIEEQQELLHSSDIREMVRNREYSQIKNSVPKEIYEDIIEMYSK